MQSRIGVVRTVGDGSLSEIDWRTDRILAILERHANAAHEFDLVADGDDAAHSHRDTVRRALRAGRPLRFVLPAFPAKSPNPQKTIGALPDLAEVIALGRLDRLCAEIEPLHPRGVEMWICSDGRVFGDLVRVPDPHITAYQRELEDMLARFGLSHLHLFGLDDVFPGADETTMRAQLIEKFARTPGEIRDDILRDPTRRLLFNGIHRFLFEDAVAIERGATRSQLRKAMHARAFEVIRRSDAWSELVAQRFPDAFRLSIHPQPRRSEKYAVRLVPSEDRWRTPWHSTAVYDGQGFRLLPRVEAERLGGRLEFFDGRYPYFLLAPYIAPTEVLR